VIYGQAGNDTLYGGTGSDRLYGSGGNDTLFGDGGSDTLDGGSGTNILHGGGGNDTFFFSQGVATIDGGTGTDTLSFAHASSAVEYIEGAFNLENTSFHGRVGILTTEFGDLIPDSAVEKIIGSPYADTFYNIPDFSAPFTIPTIQGGAGNDSLTDYGGGNMFGGSGNDTLFAGLRSHLTGGSGHDTFQIDLGAPDSLVPDGAVITDFHHGEDVILIGDVGSGASLTHNGDLWTIHDGSDQLTFEVSGVTQLQAGVDYEFS